MSDEEAKIVQWNCHKDCVEHKALDFKNMTTEQSGEHFAKAESPCFCTVTSAVNLDAMDKAVLKVTGGHIGTCDFCGAAPVWVEKMPYKRLKRYEGKFGCNDCMMATIDARRSRRFSRKRVHEQNVS